MERKYQIKSAKYGIELTFTFAENGYLTGLELSNAPDISKQEYYDYICSQPMFKEYFLNVCKKHNIKYTEVLPDLSFTTFWNKYQYKDGGSKIKAEAIWKKMSDAERSKALAYITRYKQSLQTKGIAQCYATTYLNGQYWNN